MVYCNSVCEHSLRVCVFFFTSQMWNSHLNLIGCYHCKLIKLFNIVYSIPLTNIDSMTLMCWVYLRVFIWLYAKIETYSKRFSLGSWVMYTFNYIWQDFICSTEQIWPFRAICFVAWPVCNGYVTRLLAFTLLYVKLEKHISNVFSLGRSVMNKFSYI